MSGYRDAERSKPWERNSIVMPYSVSKPFAAVCALLLVDRGSSSSTRRSIDIGRGSSQPQTFASSFRIRPGSSPWMTLPGPASSMTGRRCARDSKSRIPLVPGSAIGELALFYGHLVGELVRRVDGRSLGAFLSDEVCTPLGLEFAIGLDAAQRARAVEPTGLDAICAEPASRPPLYQRAMNNPPGARDAEVVNSDAFSAAEMPAINCHGTARGVAGLYAALLDKQLLSAGLLAEATTAQATGVDLVIGGEERSWGLGFYVDDDGYGMGGMFASAWFTPGDTVPVAR